MRLSARSAATGFSSAGVTARGSMPWRAHAARRARLSEGGSVSETFTVRKLSAGVGVNRVFAVNSPKIEKITVVRKGKVRRAKLNFLKNMVGGYRIKERGQK